MNPPAGRLHAWWQLLRAANIPTAMSNVVAGFLVVQGEWQPIGPLLLLVFSSMLFFEAGMVLNDALDAKLDAVERPERPIPSGRIARGQAFFVGWTLLASGTACSWLVSWQLGSVAPAIVGSSLAIMIVLYDSGLKKIWAGPLAMGWCRMLNVLLGGSVASAQWGSSGIWWFAIGVGIYTAGITLLARSETGPSPQVVRQQVKTLLLGFIVIDAAVAAGAAGWMSGLAVLSLLIPALIASRWAPMT